MTEVECQHCEISMYTDMLTARLLREPYRPECAFDRLSEAQKWWLRERGMEPSVWCALRRASDEQNDLERDELLHG